MGGRYFYLCWLCGAHGASHMKNGRPYCSDCYEAASHG